MKINQTFKNISRLRQIATVFAKPKGREFVDTVVSEVSQDTWIYFPWDTEPQYVTPIADGPRKAR